MNREIAGIARHRSVIAEIGRLQGPMTATPRDHGDHGDHGDS